MKPAGDRRRRLARRARRRQLQQMSGTRVDQERAVAFPRFRRSRTSYGDDVRRRDVRRQPLELHGRLALVADSIAKAPKAATASKSRPTLDVAGQLIRRSISRRTVASAGAGTRLARRLSPCPRRPGRPRPCARARESPAHRRAWPRSGNEPPAGSRGSRPIKNSPPQMAPSVPKPAPSNTTPITGSIKAVVRHATGHVGVVMLDGQSGNRSGQARGHTALSRSRDGGRARSTRA